MELASTTSLPGGQLATPSVVGLPTVTEKLQPSEVRAAPVTGDPQPSTAPVIGRLTLGGDGDATPVAPKPPRGAPDRFARWALRVRDRDGDPDVHNIFSSSIALSATRCLLSYIILPVLAPWLGTLPLIGPAIGVPVGVLALVFDVRAIKRFFQADHRWRWVAATLYLVVMAMVTALVIRDISRLTRPR